METWMSVAGVGGGGVLAAACAYKLIRPRFPVRVNCWFCGTDTVVPFGNQNCWDCPQCEQYNGFEKDGGYNKAIPAQHKEELNHAIGCKTGEYLASGSGLCSTCEENQLLKVRQLASFVPMIEDNYDAEIDAYKDHLESVYELCDNCRNAVEKEIMKQDDILRSKIETNKLELSRQSKTSQCLMTSMAEETASAYTRTGYFLSFLSVLCALLILACGLVQIDGLMDSWIPPGSWLLATFLQVMDPVRQSVHYTGLSLCLVSKLFMGKDRLRGIDVAGCFTWLLVAAVVTREVTQSLPSVVFHENLLAGLFTLNFVLTFASSVIRRERNTATKKTFKRLSLDKSTGSIQSDTNTEAISSVSTSRRARSDLDLATEVTEEPMDDLDLDMDAFSLGPKTNTMKRSDSGMFSMAGSHTSFSTASALPQPILGQSRPLICPARLNVRMSSSTPANISPKVNRQMTNPAFDSSNRQSLQFSSLQQQQPMQSSTNLFLKQGLTSEKLSLFNSQNSDQINPQSHGQVQGQNWLGQSQPTGQGQVSPLRSNLWQHEKFAQTNLSPDRLSQLKFSTGKVSPNSGFKSDAFRSVSRPNTPIRKSLWQQKDTFDQRAAPIQDNNVFSLKSSQNTNIFDNSTISNSTSATLLTALDGVCEGRQRIFPGHDVDTQVEEKEDSSKSSDCPVDSTTSFEPPKSSKLQILKKAVIGTVLVASVVGNAVLGVYLYTKA